MLTRRLGEQKATSHTRMQHLGFDLADENSSDEQIYEATVEFLAMDLLRASTICTGQFAEPHFRSSDSSQSGQGQKPEI